MVVTTTQSQVQHDRELVSGLCKRSKTHGNGLRPKLQKVRESVRCICLITPKCPLRPHARRALGIFGCYATHLPLSLPHPYTFVSVCQHIPVHMGLFSQTWTVVPP